MKIRLSAASNNPVAKNELRSIFKGDIFKRDVLEKFRNE